MVETGLRRVTEKFTTSRGGRGSDALRMPVGSDPFPYPNPNPNPYEAPDRFLVDMYGVAGYGGERRYGDGSDVRFVENTTYSGISVVEPASPDVAGAGAYGASAGGRFALPAPPVVTAPTPTAARGLFGWRSGAGEGAKPTTPSFRSPVGDDATPAPAPYPAPAPNPAPYPAFAPAATPGTGGWTMRSPRPAAGEQTATKNPQ